MLRRLSILFFSILVLTGFESGERIFAPGPDLWERWQEHDAQSTVRVDHSLWDDILERHVQDSADSANLVDYAAMISESATSLDAYLSMMAETPVSTLNRVEQYAFWLNLYNAVTVRVVLDHYPVDSIQDIDISPGFFASGPWGAEVITVEGISLTLNDIEHRILRPIWQDPRIHYGVNCASIGCPDLMPTAFTSENLEDQLDAGARRYVNDPRGVSINEDRVTVSKIYDWFIEDFDRTETGILEHLSQYADPELAAELARIGQLHSVRYDWSINSVQ